MTTTVGHLIDDAAIGGVTRFLDALATGLGPQVRQTRHVVSPNRQAPPNLDADVVVVHFTMSWSKLPYLLALRARRGRRPIVLVEHSYSGAFEERFVASTRRFRALLRAAYAVVDRVVAVSYGQSAWMRRSRLLPAEKLAVIRPFTDCQFLLRVPAPAHRQGPLRLGAYGRYCAQKDFALLIDAMRAVDPAIATLTVRGFGPDADDLKSRAAALPHVTIGDAIDDVAEFLGAIDALVVPSCFEPFGQVGLEARLAARPLIVTDVDGLPEQVDAGAGFVVPHGDPRALADAIMHLARIRGDEPWASYCATSRASALDHAATGVHRWQLLLQDLLGERRRKHAETAVLMSGLQPRHPDSCDTPAA